jgi:4-hydroxy-tetrahydrodipicolinate reductase
MQRIAIVGATGRMGTLAVDAIAEAEDLALVALVARRAGPARSDSLWAGDLNELDPASLDTVVDLSVTEVARRTLEWVLTHEKDAVIGTSGLTDDDLKSARDRAGTGGSGILVVPNFSIGAALLVRFAALAAPHFERVEVIELHHDQKRDAPSGTSIATATAIANARSEAGLGDTVDRTETETLDGARGAAGPGGVRLHSVRLPGLVAHQEVVFGAPGEGLTLRHDTYDRASFMAGLLACLRAVPKVKGVAVGMDTVLGS